MASRFYFVAISQSRGDSHPGLFAEKGFCLANCCHMCHKSEESAIHILFTCHRSVRVWKYIVKSFGKSRVPHRNLTRGLNGGFLLASREVGLLSYGTSGLSVTRCFGRCCRDQGLGVESLGCLCGQFLSLRLIRHGSQQLVTGIPVDGQPIILRKGPMRSNSGQTEEWVDSDGLWHQRRFEQPCSL